tara:strand:+ start:374 stop:763 length:390 start_codon:yes stop_codon:yes gene_type:complete
MKKILILLGFFTLVSCTNIQTTNYYSSVSRENATQYIQKFEGKSFKIYDDAEASAAFVMEGLATDTTKALFEGLTLGIVDLTASPTLFEGAMRNFLKQKNKNCVILRRYFVPDGQGGGKGYEFFYDCRD